MADTVALGLFVVAFLSVSGLPFLYGMLSSPADKEFMGIVLNVPDTAQYLSWAREARSGVLIDNKLTPERGEAVFFNLFWFAVGRLSILFNLGLAETTQLMRLAAGALYLLAAYWVIHMYIDDRASRWVAFLVFALGGGLGWLLVVFKQFSGVLPYPLDLYTMESNAFLTVMAFPHQTMAGALLVGALGLAALAIEKDRPGVATWSGLAVALLGLIHAYDLLIVYTVVGATTVIYWLKERKRVTWLVGALVCVPSLPAAAYSLAITQASPIWHGVLAQYGNAGVYTPQPFHLIILMGIPLALLLVLKPTPSGLLTGRELLLLCWLVGGLLLIYLPADFQIKMLLAWQLPVGVAATRAWGLLAEAIAARQGHGPQQVKWRTLALYAVILLVVPTNVYLLAWRFVDLGRHDYPYYLYRDEIAAFAWLDTNAPEDEVVLSSLMLGQYLPSLAGNKAFLAHWAQTLDFYGKMDSVNRFFEVETGDEWRRGLIDRYEVKYVVWGRIEKELGAYSPHGSPLMHSVFSSGRTTVFEIVPQTDGRQGMTQK